MFGTRTAFYFLALVLIIFAVVGDVVLNHWAKNSGRLWHLVVGFLLCNVALSIWTASLKKGTLLEAAILYDVGTNVLLILASRFIFSEILPRQVYVGAVIAILGVVYMQWHMPVPIPVPPDPC